MTIFQFIKQAGTLAKQTKQIQPYQKSQLLNHQQKTIIIDFLRIMSI